MPNLLIVIIIFAIQGKVTKDHILFFFFTEVKSHGLVTCHSILYSSFFFNFLFVYSHFFNTNLAIIGRIQATLRINKF